MRVAKAIIRWRSEDAASFWSGFEVLEANARRVVDQNVAARPAMPLYRSRRVWASMPTSTISGFTAASMAR